MAISVRLGRCLDCRDSFAVEASLVPVPKTPGWYYALCRDCYDQSRTLGRSPFKGEHIVGGRVRRIAPGQRWHPRGRPEAPMSETERSLLARAYRFDDGVGPAATALRVGRTRRDEDGTWLELL